MRIVATGLPPLHRLSRSQALLRALRCGLDPFAIALDMSQTVIGDDPNYLVLPMLVHAQLSPSDAIAFRDQDKR